MPKPRKKHVPIVSTHAARPPPSSGSQGNAPAQPHKRRHQHDFKELDGEATVRASDAGDVAQRSCSRSAPAGQAVQRPPFSLVCHSIIDRQAARALHALVEAGEGNERRGATLKSLTLAPHIVEKKATYAVTCQALKHLSVLKDLVDSSGLMQQPRMSQMSKCTAYVLVYELLMGQGLGQKGVAERLVLKHADRLRAALDSLLERELAPDVAGLLAQREVAPPPQHPRWVRVNTLKMSVQDALRHTQAKWPDAVVDPLLPDVLRLPAGTALHNHPLVKQGALVLQSKASCMPAHALSPAPGWHCVDCCAAPGNKTTHLAALLQGSGRVTAFDRDAVRLRRLEANAALCGAQVVVQARLQDFLSVDTHSPDFAQVRGVLLDPSCSGSGTLVSRQDHRLPGWAAQHSALQRERAQHAALIARAVVQQGHADQGPHPTGDGSAAKAGQNKGRDEHDGAAGEDDGTQGARLEALSRFQVAALRHALTFPALQRLVYSTCSIHIEENERVVQAVLPHARELGFELQTALPGWHRRGLPVFPGCEKLVRADPFEDDTDGFFVALFERVVPSAGVTTHIAQHGSKRKRADRTAALVEEVGSGTRIAKKPRMQGKAQALR